MLIGSAVVLADEGRRLVDRVQQQQQQQQREKDGEGFAGLRDIKWTG